MLICLLSSGLLSCTHIRLQLLIAAESREQGKMTCPPTATCYKIVMQSSTCECTHPGPCMYQKQDQAPVIVHHSRVIRIMDQEIGRRLRQANEL